MEGSHKEEVTMHILQGLDTLEQAKEQYLCRRNILRVR